MSLARRLIVISDLHLGGAEHPMLGHPEILTEFLEGVAQSPDASHVELVIAGDFVDFLAEKPFAPWTQSESGACDKLDAVAARLATRNESDVFRALRTCAASIGRLTILLGNHDIELAYPRAQSRLFTLLGTDPHRCHFVHDNQAYRVGDVLIEHGNRYDVWNAIDHDGLRQIVSCASRDEGAPRALLHCPGSQLVYGAMNPMKERYQFVDLLKPEGKLLALLLFEIEPTMTRQHMRELFRLARAWIDQRKRRGEFWLNGARATPTAEHLVADGDSGDLPREIREAYSAALGEFETPVNPVAASQAWGWVARAAFSDEEDGIAALAVREQAIPQDRVRRLQRVFAEVLEGDPTFADATPDGPYHAAADAIAARGAAKVVIMGHTHLARRIPISGGGLYLNTGTWADLIRIGPELLVDSREGREAFEAWLKNVALNRLNGIRRPVPHFADVRVDCDGHVDDKPRVVLYERGRRLEDCPELPFRGEERGLCEP